MHGEAQLFTRNRLKLVFQFLCVHNLSLSIHARYDPRLKTRIEALQADLDEECQEFQKKLLYVHNFPMRTHQL